MQTTKITLDLDTDALVEVILDNAAKLGIPNLGSLPEFPAMFETVEFRQSYQSHGLGRSFTDPQVPTKTVSLTLSHIAGQGKEAAPAEDA